MVENNNKEIIPALWVNRGCNMASYYILINMGLKNIKKPQF